MTNVHICAFNANEYQARLLDLFPDLHISISEEHGVLEDGIQTCEVLLTFGPILTDEAFLKNTSLEWVQALGTGVDGVVDRPAFPRDVTVTSMRGLHGPQMSELAFMMMLAFSRDFRRTLNNQAERNWSRWPPKILYGKTVGIWGVGKIAEDLAKRCKAFDMTVAGITSSPRQLENFDLMVSREKASGVLKDLDYLVLLMPYTPGTEGMIGETVFRELKSSCYFINLARGKVVDDDALLNALDAGEIAGAGLDVFAEEPLPTNSPFWSREDVIVTPHMGGLSESYVDQAMPVIEQNFRAFLAGKPDGMINRVEVS